jgi:hypothetical protein
VSVYALTNSRVLPVVPGVRLRPVRAGTLTALVTDARRAPAPTPANLRRYHRTVAAIADVVPAALPARFGTVIPEAELAIVLLGRAASFRAALRHVRGNVQMTIRLIAAAPADRGPVERTKADGGRTRFSSQSRPESGSAYLRSRAAQARDIPGFQPLRAVVEHWIRDERVERHEDIVSVYHLVPRRSAATYAAAMNRALADARLRAIVSGPFPPYAFSSW